MTEEPVVEGIFPEEVVAEAVEIEAVVEDGIPTEPEVNDAEEVAQVEEVVPVDTDAA